MPTRFASLMQKRGAPLLANVLGMRNADGQLEEALFELTAFGREYTGPGILTAEDSAATVDAVGDVEKQRTLTLRIERRHLPGLVATPQRGSVKIDGAPYAIADSGSRLDESYLTLAVIRAQLSENAPQRR